VISKTSTVTWIRRLRVPNKRKIFITQ